MSVPANTYRCEVQGGMPAGEVFAWGWWARRGGDQGASAATQAADVVADSNFRDFIAVCKTIATPATAYQRLHVTRFGAGGTVDDSAVISLGAAAGPGTSGNTHPNYTALCVTLRDDVSNATHRNRFYLPATGAGLGGDGLLIAQKLSDVADGAAAYWVGGTAVIMSLKRSAFSQVTHVTVDSKMDLQRGRHRDVRGTIASRP